MHSFAVLLNIFQRIVRFDQQLFKKINGQWSNSFFDFLFPLIRQSFFWMPWYLFLFVFVIFNLRKNAPWWILLFICTVALTDLTGTQLFKHLIERFRPCEDPNFFSSVRMILKECAGGHSFVSNHAANNFGLATFVFFTLRKYFKKLFWVVWIWPIAVSYGQVYVGVHYPSDVFAGAVIGLLFGSLTATLFHKKFTHPDEVSRIGIS